MNRGLSSRTIVLGVRTQGRCVTPRRRWPCACGFALLAGAQALVGVLRAPFVRTPGTIVRELGPVHDSATPARRAPQHKPGLGQPWRKEPAEVIGEIYAEAQRRDPPHEHAWAVLVDGNRTQIDQVQQEAAARGRAHRAGARRHPRRRYLWQAAWCFQPSGEPGRRAAGEASGLLRAPRGPKPPTSPRASAAARPCAGCPPPRARAPTAAADYMLAKTEYSTTSGISRTGWPIATGIIEAACRHLVRIAWTYRRSRSLDGADAFCACARCAPATTSTPTGASTSKANAHETTCPSTPGRIRQPEATPRHGPATLSVWRSPHPSPILSRISAENWQRGLAS